MAVPVAAFFSLRVRIRRSNDYRAANKQFIAPLPVPRAPPAQKAEVAERAELFQDLHTRRRALIARLDKRLASTQCEDAARDTSVTEAFEGRKLIRKLLQLRRTDNPVRSSRAPRRLPIPTQRGHCATRSRPV